MRVPAELCSSLGLGLLGTIGAESEQCECLVIDGRGPRRDGDRSGWVGTHASDVVGQSAQVAQQCPEAVQRQTVVGVLARIRGLGLLGARCL